MYFYKLQIFIICVVIKIGTKNLSVACKFSDGLRNEVNGKVNRKGDLSARANISFMSINFPSTETMYCLNSKAD